MMMASFENSVTQIAKGKPQKRSLYLYTDTPTLHKYFTMQSVVGNIKTV